MEEGLSRSRRVLRVESHGRANAGGTLVTIIGLMPVAFARAGAANIRATSSDRRFS